MKITITSYKNSIQVDSLLENQPSARHMTCSAELIFPLFVLPDIQSVMHHHLKWTWTLRFQFSFEVDKSQQNPNYLHSTIN